jgi:hypothetical protein
VRGANLVGKTISKLKFYSKRGLKANLRVKCAAWKPYQYL